MTMLVSLLPDGSMKKEIVASIARGLRSGNAYPEDLETLKTVFRNPSLQMVSFTITEKGYALTDIHGNYFPFVLADFAGGPGKCSHAMCTVTALLYERYQAEGTFSFTIDGQTKIVCKGDSLLKENGVIHGCTCLKAGTLLDIFSPMREDFLKQQEECEI